MWQRPALLGFLGFLGTMASAQAPQADFKPPAGVSNLASFCRKTGKPLMGSGLIAAIGDRAQVSLRWADEKPGPASQESDASPRHSEPALCFQDRLSWLSQRCD